MSVAFPPPLVKPVMVTSPSVVPSPDTKKVSSPPSPVMVRLVPVTTAVTASAANIARLSNDSKRLPISNVA